MEVFEIVGDVLPEEVETSAVTLIDFYADWCGPCKMMAPVIESIAAAEEATAMICKCNVDQNPEIASAYGVMSIPTLVILKEGEEYSRMVGVQKQSTLTDALQKAKAE
ncbi:MAG: thioredoxin [Clostridiales bacterium]|nr:thioredoxin [Clostridiales bacterium]